MWARRASRPITTIAAVMHVPSRHGILGRCPEIGGITGSCATSRPRPSPGMLLPADATDTSCHK